MPLITMLDGVGTILTVVDHKNYILQYTPEIWNGIGNYHFEIFSF